MRRNGLASKFNFEQAMQRLEQIVAELESGKLGLDESLKIFEEGVELSRKCYEKLASAELRIKELIKKENGQFELGSFDQES